LAFAVTILMNHLIGYFRNINTFLHTAVWDGENFRPIFNRSSIMRKRKTPISLEVIKGKASVSAGLLQGLIGMEKLIFIGYNRDSQWAKYLITD